MFFFHGGTEERVFELGVHCLQLSDDVFHSVPLRVIFVRTVSDLLAVALFFGVLFEEPFANETERTDDGDGEFVHLHDGAHGSELPLEGEVHQCCLHDVIFVVSKCYFVASELLGKLEQFFASVPRTQEAVGVPLVG